MHNPPIIRLEMEQMKFQILQVVQTYHQDIEKYIEQEIKKAIEGFDFEREVRESADEALRKVVGDSVTSMLGWGFREEVHIKVREMMREKLADKGAQDQM